MKKIFTLFCSLFTAFSAQAQLSVTYCGEEVSEGDVLILPYEYSDPYGIGYNDFYYADPWDGMDPTLTNTSASTQTVLVSVSLQDDYAPWSICGLGYNVCIDMTKSYDTCSFDLAAGASVTSQIHYDGFEAGEYGTYDILCVAFCGTEDISYTLRFSYSDPSGIAQASTSGTGVTFADNALKYSFSEGTKTLQVFTTSGQMVKSFTASGTGSINFGGMMPGVYVYSVLQGNEKVETGKFLVH